MKKHRTRPMSISCFERGKDGITKKLNSPTLEDPDLSAKEPERFFKKFPRN